MIRLMLVIAPAACVLAAIGISEIMRKMGKSIRGYLTDSKAAKDEDEANEDGQDKVPS